MQNYSNFNKNISIIDKDNNISIRNQMKLTQKQIFESQRIHIAHHFIFLKEINPDDSMVIKIVEHINAVNNYVRNICLEWTSHLEVEKIIILHIEISTVKQKNFKDFCNMVNSLLHLSQKKDKKELINYKLIIKEEEDSSLKEFLLNSDKNHEQSVKMELEFIRSLGEDESENWSKETVENITYSSLYERFLNGNRLISYENLNLITGNGTMFLETKNYDKLMENPDNIIRVLCRSKLKEI